MDTHESVCLCVYVNIYTHICVCVCVGGCMDKCMCVFMCLCAHRCEYTLTARGSRLTAHGSRLTRLGPGYIFGIHGGLVGWSDHSVSKWGQGCLGKHGPDTRDFCFCLGPWHGIMYSFSLSLSLSLSLSVPPYLCVYLSISLCSAMQQDTLPERTSEECSQKVQQTSDTTELSLVWRQKCVCGHSTQDGDRCKTKNLSNHYEKGLY